MNEQSSQPAPPMSASQALAVLASGMLFGLGLAVSTMISPEVVLSFLRLQDWGLMLVMGGAMGTTLLAYQLLPRLVKRPLLGEHFAVRPAVLDSRTVLGAAVFGVGWGLCGVCPGPAIAGVGAGNWPLLVALAGIALGGYLQGWLED
jgi:uncharacterized membrane protein YedE/YeeE